MLVMDKLSQERFDALVKLDTSSMSVDDKEFLFARRGHLNKQQREQFKDLIAEGDQKIKDRENEAQEQNK